MCLIFWSDSTNIVYQEDKTGAITLPTLSVKGKGTIKNILSATIKIADFHCFIITLGS